VKKKDRMGEKNIYINTHTLSVSAKHKLNFYILGERPMGKKLKVQIMAWVLLRKVREPNYRKPNLIGKEHLCGIKSCSAKWYHG
jgi:hypothetical protein